jgi:hypothetical protein
MWPKGKIGAGAVPGIPSEGNHTVVTAMWFVPIAVRHLVLNSTMDCHRVWSAFSDVGAIPLGFDIDPQRSIDARGPALGCHKLREMRAPSSYQQPQPPTSALRQEALSWRAPATPVHEVLSLSLICREFQCG